MLSVININEPEKWDEIVTSFKDYDVYYLSAYIRACQAIEEGTPTLFYFKDNNFKAIHVVVIRDIAKNKLFAEKIPLNTYFDIITPYGYGGFLIEGGSLNTESYHNFIDEYAYYCKTNNIISEFIRFHPMLNNHMYFENVYDISFNRETIFIELEDEELIWSNMKSTSRNRIRNIHDMNVEVNQDSSEQSLEKFIELYYKTMDKNKANDSYYFEGDYFNRLMEIEESCKIFNLVFDDQVIASMVVLIGNKYIHYHLGATDPEYYHMSPNNLLFFEVAKWGFNNGYKKFHLGGGYSDAKDGLFRFKKTLNKNGVLNFYIGKKIWNTELYNMLLQIRGFNEYKNSQESFFPAYRLID